MRFLIALHFHSSILVTSYDLWIDSRKEHKFDVTGCALLSISVSSTIYPLLLTTMPTVLELDPFIVLIKESEMLANNPQLYAVATVIRIFLIFLAVSGAVRVIMLILFMFIIETRVILEIMKKILQQLEISKIFRVAHDYNVLQILLEHLQLQENVVFVLMGTGLFIISAGNFCLIVYYDKWPILLYLSTLSVITITYVTVIILMPVVIQTHSMSNSFLHDIKSICRATKNYEFKRIKNLRPVYTFVSLGSYRMFYFKRSTKSTYYMTIMTCTVNFLLSVSVTWCHEKEQWEWEEKLNYI